MPILASSASSMLVSTVTAMMVGRVIPSFRAASSTASLVAAIIVQPPEAWTLNISTPRRAASTPAFETVLGIS